MFSCYVVVRPIVPTRIDCSNQLEGVIVLNGLLLLLLWLGVDRSHGANDCFANVILGDASGVSFTFALQRPREKASNLLFLKIWESL